MTTDYNAETPRTWAARVKARSETLPSTVPLIAAIISDPIVWQLVKEFVRMSLWERTNALYALVPLAGYWIQEAAHAQGMKAREQEARREEWKNLSPEHLFQRLWTKAVGTADYDKAQWRALELVIPKGDKTTPGWQARHDGWTNDSPKR